MEFSSREEYERARQEFFERERMPAALRNSFLVASEVSIFCVSPVPLHGRIDQLFQLPSGRCVILDTKYRPDWTVYDSDLIQMSAYRLILQNCRYRNSYHRHKMESYGYIRFVNENEEGDFEIRYVRVELLSNREVVDLWKRYQRIHYGLEAPVCTCNGEFHTFVSPSALSRDRSFQTS